VGVGYTAPPTLPDGLVYDTGRKLSLPAVVSWLDQPAARPPKIPTVGQDAEARERGGEASTPASIRLAGDAAPGGRYLKDLSPAEGWARFAHQASGWSAAGNTGMSEDS